MPSDFSTRTRFGALTSVACALALPVAASAAHITPPPASDGSSGSFDAQFGSGSTPYDGPLTYWNLDTGVVYACIYGGCTPQFTVPFETIQWNGQTVNAYNFSSLTVEQTISLTIYGATPAVFLSQGGINIAGQFVFQNTNIAGGTPSTGMNGAYDGGPGAGVGGGGGGLGRGGQDETPCGPNQFSGSGGGGGGNFKKGGKGFKNYVPIGSPNGTPHYKGGPGGTAEPSGTLQGGGGGAAGGGGSYGGEYYGGVPGGNGGGAVALAAAGSISLAASSVLNAAGGAGGDANSVNGGSGGGAGGDVWVFAPQGVTTAGQILANGGAGGATLLSKNACKVNPLIPGPDGGDGAGGVLYISAPSISNSGTINLSGGNGTGIPNGGLLDANGVAINNTGTIIGPAKTE